MKREEGLAFTEGKTLGKAIQMGTAMVVKYDLIHLPIRNRNVALFLTMLKWIWVI